MGFFPINQPYWGSPIYRNPQISVLTSILWFNPRIATLRCECGSEPLQNTVSASSFGISLSYCGTLKKCNGRVRQCWAKLTTFGEDYWKILVHNNQVSGHTGPLKSFPPKRIWNVKLCGCLHRKMVSNRGSSSHFCKNDILGGPSHES